MSESIVNRLRTAASGKDVCHELARVRVYSNEDRLMQEAADMLELMLCQFKSGSVYMNGQHTYQFQNTGWPMTHARGPTAEHAIRAAVEEVKRCKTELKIN